MAGGPAAATVISGGTLEIVNGGSIGAGGLRFDGSGGTLTIDGSTMPTSTISGFVTGDTIDLAGVSFANGGRIQLGTGNVLTLVEGGSSYSLNLDPAQNYTRKSFRLSSDVASGTDIQAAPGASTLPVANPSTRVLALGPAEQKALGLITSTGFGDDYDGYVVFSDTLSMSYTPSAAPSDGNTYYFVGVVEHEISEVMGRTS